MAAKLTLDDLRKLRQDKKTEMTRRETEGKEIRIVIGMGTCGIAAGAKEAFDAIVEELDKQGVGGAVVQQTGCMGFCTYEPTVEIKMAGMPDVIYGKVDAAVGRLIVQKHIVEKALVTNHVYDTPSVDIIADKV